MLVIIILACGKNSDYEQMHNELMRAKAQNENYESFSSDSIMLCVADFFDSNGTANEQILSHYLLGCVYRDLGDMPRALECYHHAIGRADTINGNCDYSLLGKVHGQMAYIYNKELLPLNQLEQLRYCRRYSLMAGDTLAAIKAEDFCASAYYLLGNIDSCIAIKEHCAELYHMHGEKVRYGEVLSALIAFYVENNEKDKAERCIREVEQTQEFFQNNGDVIAGREIYYYNKGLYLLESGMTGEAGKCFRKLAATAGSNTNKEIAASRGLALLYERMGMADSTAKYAMHSYLLNDTINQRLMQATMPKMQAMYDYSQYKKAAATKTKEAAEARMIILLLTIGLLLTFTIGYIIVANIRKKKQSELLQQQHDYEMKLTLMQKAKEDLNALLADNENRNKKLIEQKTIEIDNYKRQIVAYKNDGRTAEERILCSSVVKNFQKMCRTGTVPTETDWDDLRMQMNMEMPEFYGIMNSNEQLSKAEYHICILIKLGFGIKEMCNLTGFDKYKMSKTRRQLLHKVYKQEGSSGDFDKLVRKIMSSTLF